MATPRDIAVIVGSLRKESLNRKMAKALIEIAPKTLKLEIVEIRALALFDEDIEPSPPAEWTAFRERIGRADGVLFVTPEYNRSVPGVLKNAIDHASRPYGQSAWAGKPAGVIGISIGAIGTAMAQQHLRNILAYLDMPTLGQPEVFLQNKPGLFAEDGRIGPDSQKFIQGWMDRYCEFVRQRAKAAAS